MSNPIEEYRRAVERLRAAAPDMAATLPAPEALPAPEPQVKQEKRSYGNRRAFYRPDRQAWFIAYGHGGKVVREKAGTDEDAAKRLLKRRLKEKERESFVGPQERRITIAELLDARETDLNNRGVKSKSPWSHMRAIRRHFGFDKAAAITAERLDRFVEEECKAGIKPATINRELEQLSAAYHLAVKQKRLPRSVVPYFPSLDERGNVRTGFFEPADFESLARHLPAAVADMTRLAYSLGWRKSEVSGLTWDNVDHVAHTITILTSKNGDGRSVALDDETWEIIARRWQARAWHNRKTKQTEVSPLVFHRNGRRIRDFRKVWQKALAAAQLPTTRLFHDLRRCGARDMRRAGVDPTIVMRIMGRKTDSMLRRYNISTSDAHREALAKTVELRRQRAEAEKASKVVRMRRGAA